MSKDEDTTAGGLVLVTGAAGPMGSAVATEFAKEGRDLLLHDYVLNEETQTSFKAAHPSVSVSLVAGDILDPSFAGKLFDALGARRIGVLVHAGGVPSTTEKKGQQAFEVNFTATRKLVETFQPRMEEGGAIILVASHQGALIKNPLVDFGAKRQARGSWSPTVWLLKQSQDTSFAVSQRCIQLYVKQKAAELSPLGVRIVSVSPGLFGTSSLGATGDSRDQAQTASPGRASTNRSARPHDVAPVVTFLASPGAAYITGTDILVDGGLASQRRRASRNMPTGLRRNNLEKGNGRNRLVRKKSQLSMLAPTVPPKDSDQDDQGIRKVVDKEEPDEIADEGKDVTEKGEPASTEQDSQDVTEKGDTSDSKEAAGPADKVVNKTITTGNTQPDVSSGTRTSSVRRIRSSLDSVRARFDKIQTEGLGGQRKASHGEAHTTGEQAEKVEAGRGSKSGLSSLPEKPLPEKPDTEEPNTHRGSVEQQKQNDGVGANGAQQTGSSGLKSMVGTVRSKLDNIQQQGLRSKKQQDTIKASTKDGEGAEGQGIRSSSVGTVRAKLKKLQEKNAARAKASSTIPQEVSAGVLQPAAEKAEKSHSNAAKIEEGPISGTEDKTEEARISGTDDKPKEAWPEGTDAEAFFDNHPPTTDVKED